MSRATKRPTVVIGFEGLLMNATEGVKEEIGEPLDHDMKAREFLVALRDIGWHVIILTSKWRPREVKNWLRGYGMESLVDSITPLLPEQAVALIHPRAIRFRGNYYEALDRLEELESRGWR